MSVEKIIRREELAPLLAAVRREGKRVVFTNGCFDILHRGHVDYLAEARSLGELLVVALNDDASVVRLKGPTRPVNKLADRMAVIAALESVRFVTWFTEDTPIETLSLLKPDIHVKGGDYKPETLPEYATVTAYGGRVKTVSFRDGYSTTAMIERAKKP
ncbi:MAG: D-glycero-beta-D-manno-heptose 1-phosphate adenylyltransferase [Spirochaetota bacterium]